MTTRYWKEKLLRFSQSVSEDESVQVDSQVITAEKLADPHNNIPEEAIELAANQTKPNESAQHGVVQAEAITLTWTKKFLAFAYFWMWMLYLVNAMQSAITGSLSPYITSDWEEHSLLTVIPIITECMGAASYMPQAKILNLFDRSTGLILMTAIATLGLILSACCNTLATYAAAQAFYTVGFAGVIFSVDVFTADTSTLRHRALAYAYTSSPYMISAFAGPAAANYFNDTNWRWAYGAFAIILPIVAAPLVWVQVHHVNKAKKAGLLQERPKSGRSWKQNIVYYTIQFDLLGVILLAAGLVLFLLPFAVAGDTASGWSTPSVIVELVIGFLCLVAFVVCERWVAPVPFLPWGILMSRTVIGICLQDVVYQISYYCWNGYYTSYLQVVYYQGLTSAGNISNIFNIVSGICGIAVGILVAWTGRYKWMFYWSVPLYTLTMGLMIYFRRPGWGLGYQIMCQIFISIAGSTFIYIEQTAVLAASDHNNAAAALAILGVFGNMGGAIGSSISGAIWTHTFPGALQRLLPADIEDQWETIYDSLDAQLSYAAGTAARTAIGLAYAVAQEKMLIAGTAFISLSFIFALIIRDIKLKKEVQNKGTLF